MTKAKAVGASQSARKMRPALTPEARENQLVLLAMDLVEKRIIEGTASSQETTHFLKIGSSKEKIEKKILEKQEALLEAKTQALQSAKNNDELYANALDAMRNYSGNGDSDDY